MAGPTTIDDTLKERGGRYGEYTKQASIAQNLKDEMRLAPSWQKLEGYQREALDMVANKLARILNGDPNYIDSWHDIIGYVRLVENELHRREQLDHAGSIGEKELSVKDMDIDTMRDGTVREGIVREGIVRRRATIEEVAAGP